MPTICGSCGKRFYSGMTSKVLGPRSVGLRTVVACALLYAVGDALASFVLTGAWMATATRTVGIGAFVFVLAILSKRNAP
jgi:hypothetical protein